jgi:glycosyltransferase involved in cell wall biosynthesis
LNILITRPGDCLAPDGVNLFIFELSDALIQLGHEVHILSEITGNIPPGGSTILFKHQVQQMFSVKEVPNPISLRSAPHGGNILLNYLESNLLFATKGSRVIRAISPDMTIFNGATAAFCPCFRVLVNHDFEFRAKFTREYDTIAYRTFDKIVSTSSELAQAITTKLHLPVNKVTVIPICIDTAKFSPRAGNQRIHAILHVGPRQEKRPDITIEAFARIARNDQEIKLFIAGPIHPENVLYTQIRKMERGVQDRIVVLGAISKEELVNLYSSVKVTCVPSDYRIPVCSPTVIESLAAGTPVVGSLSAISKDLLVDGYDGFRVIPYNIEMFASRLQLLIHNKQLWSEMSRNALRLSKRCDKKSVARDYLMLFKNSSGFIGNK